MTGGRVVAGAVVLLLAVATGSPAAAQSDPDPTLSIDSPSVTEGDSGQGTLTFTATLSPASAQQVTVDYADAGTGTAASGTDYAAITAGTLTFAAGTTSRTFDVSVTGDTVDEADETIQVALSNASGATISTTAGTGTGTVTDDDPTDGDAGAGGFVHRGERRRHHGDRDVEQRFERGHHGHGDGGFRASTRWGRTRRSRLRPGARPTPRTR